MLTFSTSDIAGAVFLQCVFLICEATFYFELEGPTHMGYQPSAMCISQVLSKLCLRRFRQKS